MNYCSTVYAFVVIGARKYWPVEKDQEQRGAMDCSLKVLSSCSRLCFIFRWLKNNRSFKS